MIEVKRQLNKISKIEKCSKCGAFKIFSIYENGKREKEVWSIRGIKCNHKWRTATNKEIGDIK